VQPSARSGFTTAEPSTRASADQPFGHASAATGMVSDAVALDASPPPATAGALMSDAAALLATLTVIRTGGYEAPGERRNVEAKPTAFIKAATFTKERIR
jgi:hypothetical protein